MIVVGVPREIKAYERRVGLTPKGAGVLHSLGITVLVEKDAGFGCGYSDESYEKQGAEVLPDARTLYASAVLIQKVKEPQPAEFSFLGKQHILFCFLHLAAPENRDLVKTLLHTGLISIGFETVEVNGKTPILKPMSEIAGGLASIYAAFFHRSGSVKIDLSADLFGKLSSLASQYPSCPPGWDIGRVVIFGGGVAGEKAAEFALNMKGDVLIIEKSEARRKELRNRWNGDASRLAILGPEDNIQPYLEKAEVLIGCVHTPGRRAVRALDVAALKAISLNRKKIIMDVAIDQGGNFPGSHATSYENPAFLDSCGNLRFAVANMPSLCGRGASDALTEVTLSYTAAMARDYNAAINSYPELARAVNTQGGKLKNQAVEEAHQL